MKIIPNLKNHFCNDVFEITLVATFLTDDLINLIKAFSAHDIKISAYNILNIVFERGYQQYIDSIDSYEQHQINYIIDKKNINLEIYNHIIKEQYLLTKVMVNTQTGKIGFLRTDQGPERIINVD